MTVKQLPNSHMSPDGSTYVTLTDGAGNLAPTASIAQNIVKQFGQASQAPDGSFYITLTDGSGNLN